MTTIPDQLQKAAASPSSKPSSRDSMTTIPDQLQKAALERRLLSLLVRRDQDTDPAASALTVLPLWAEKEVKPGVPHERPNAWRVLVFGASTPYTTVLFAEQVEVDGEIGAFAPHPQRILAALNSGDSLLAHGVATMAEVFALAARCRIPMRFDYAKQGADKVEQRRGIVLGVRGRLLFIEDGDREGAMRGFRLDGITCLRPAEGVALPRWVEGQGYTMPGAEVPRE
jgi:hypothetical protein